MINVKVATLIACLAIGSVCQGQVPENVSIDRYDIGLVEAQEVAPSDKGDVLVVIGAKWCGPCMRMYPQWATLRAAGYRVVYIDWNKPTWNADKPEDEAIVKKFAAMKDNSVPDVYVYNTETDEVVEEWHQFVKIKDIKEHLWKPSSSTGLVPEFLR